jgi:SNF family Na+-dependent transporter
MAVSYGSLWRFPHLYYENGGAVFLVPYLLAVFFIAIPMQAMETAFAQS